MSESLHQETNDELMRLRSTIDEMKANRTLEREHIAIALLQSLVDEEGGADSSPTDLDHVNQVLSELSKE